MGLFNSSCICHMNKRWEFVPECGCCWLQHGNFAGGGGGGVAKRVSLIRFQDLRTNIQAVFKCNVLGVSQARHVYGKPSWPVLATTAV